jgi:hypothetical protein
LWAEPAVIAQDNAATASAQHGVAVSVAVAVNLSAQQPATESNSSPQTQHSSRTLEEKIELAKLRLAIRQQELEIAQLERKMLLSKVEAQRDRPQQAEKDLRRLEEELHRVQALFKAGNVSLQKVQDVQAQLEKVRAAQVAAKAGHQVDRVEVRKHDAQIRLLELQRDLEQVKLTQLQNKLPKK